MADETGKRIDLRTLLLATGDYSEPTLLVPSNTLAGHLDKTWNVIVNAELELDK
jgi:predicted transcriptional regulator of viral defense system